MLVFAFLLAVLALGVSVALSARLRTLATRLAAMERRLESRGPRESAALPERSSLAGVRVAFDVRQDHPQPVFATLLREALLREEALLDDDAPDVLVKGEVIGNGYADVYYRADLTVEAGGESLFALTERPPHGDRPTNLALETVQRLKTEWAKRERRNALLELGG